MIFDKSVYLLLFLLSSEKAYKKTAGFFRIIQAQQKRKDFLTEKFLPAQQIK